MNMSIISQRPSLLTTRSVCRTAPARRSLVIRAAEVKPTDEPKAEPGNIGDGLAEVRKNLGVPGEKSPDFQQAQAFDGPAPETINSRLAMLGVLAALGAEFKTGANVKEQIQAAPVSVLLTFVIISLASYIPIFRGYTKKEDFSNAVFTPKAENWNGRLAMIGFFFIAVIEGITKKSTLDFWGVPHATSVFNGFF